MDGHILTYAQISAFEGHLRAEERAPGTVEKYLRDLESFLVWLDGRSVTKEASVEWKEHLLSTGHAPVTVNSMIAALNGLCAFLGWDCKVKLLKIQRRVFREQRRELTREEYGALVNAAQSRGKDRLALLMETICGTGIRVSEVPYITVEAAKQGRAEVTLKGKIRVILLPGKLCRKLLKYAHKNKIASGEIFVTRNGKSISRKQIWTEMKRLCALAGVHPEKVFPHNLRHLFARAFYKVCRDIVRLADVLGHSSVETTRIYLMTTGTEHMRQMERLGLIS